MDFNVQIEQLCHIDRFLLERPHQAFLIKFTSIQLEIFKLAVHMLGQCIPQLVTDFEFCLQSLGLVG